MHGVQGASQGESQRERVQDFFCAGKQLRYDTDGRYALAPAQRSLPHSESKITLSTNFNNNQQLWKRKHSCF